MLNFYANDICFYKAGTTLMPHQCPTCLFNSALLDAGWLNLDVFNPGSAGVCPPTISNKIVVDTLFIGQKCCCAFVR